MKHSEYWRRRFEQVNESLLQHGENYNNDLEREYRRAAQNIEKDLTVWYKRLAVNNDISFAEAKQLLNKNELKEFHWTVDEYIKYGEENAVNQSWVKQLENASARVHISRLEAIKLQVQQHAEVLYGNQLDGLDKTMRKLYADGYYHTAFEVQRGLNVGYNLHQIDDRRIEAVIAKPWAADGRNFSDRIWQDKNRLINTLHTELTQSTIRGDPPDRAIQTMVDKLKVSKNNAGRLVMTESAFFASASQKDCFKDLDVEEYEIVATLDSYTSPTCREMDGKVFKMADYKPGITAPPFHGWCRSCTAPYFGDNKGERAARGEDGKTYHVPSDMKYEDWKKVYVDKAITPEDWQKAQGNGIIKQDTLKEKIQKIKEQSKGAHTEADIKSAGALVQNNLVLNRQECKERLDAAKALYDSFGWERLIAEKFKLAQINRRLIEPKELGYASKEEAYARYKEVERQLNALMDNPAMSEAYYKMTDIKRDYQGKQQENITELRKKLAEIREIGGGNHDIAGHLNHSRSPMAKVVSDAYDIYPSEWVEKSVKLGNLTPKKVTRGYYNGKEIAISGDGDQAIATAIHELGHRFETAVPGIRAAEKMFYERRTAGESLEWLGGGYDRSEKTRKDDFLNAYMGKDYGGRAYELVSMGFQYAYADPTKLWEDEDMAQWIYGILSLL